MNKLGVALGVIAGTAVVAGGLALAIPEIKDNVLNVGNDDKPVVSEKDETNVEQSNFQVEIDRLTAELTSKNSKLTEYETLISEKTSRIEELTAIESSLRAEIETYKELAGSNANYFEMINELTTQLTAVTSERDNLLIQVEQLTSDNEILTNNVAQLEAELAEAKEKLGNYIATENVDHLQVASYNGTWYLNGTYEDYFEIENGQVSRGNQAIKGVIQEQNKEMKMWLNDGTFETIKLTNNGTSIEINGAVYKNYIVSTITEVTPNYLYIIGTYNYGNEQIVLNSDNTCSYFDGIKTIHGAFTVKSIEKNIAGNIDIIQTISMSLFDSNDSKLIYSFEFVNNEREFIFNNNHYVSTSSPALEFDPGLAEKYKTNCFKVTILLSKKITITNNSTVYTNYHQYNAPGVTSTISSTKPTCNGLSDGINQRLAAKNKTGYDMIGDCFTFYMQLPNSNYYNQIVFDDFTTFNNNAIKNIIVEEIGDAQSNKYYCLSDHFKSKYLSSEMTKTCDAIPGLVAGNYSADGLDFTITEDGSAYSSDFIGGITFDSEHNIVNNFVHGEPTAENTFICDKGVLGLPGEVYPESKYGTYIDITNCPDFFMPNTEYFAMGQYALNGKTQQTNGPTFVVSEEDFSKIKYLYVNFFDESMLTGTNLNVVDIYVPWLHRVHDQYNLSFGAAGEYINCYIGEVPEPSVVFTASAETDGHDIYHNVTATITETSYAEDGSLVSIDKVLTFKLKNNTQIIDATLNGSEIILVKV